MERTKIAVVLELVIGAEPIAGSLHRRGRDPQPFRGWLELASAIEQARGTEDGRVTSSDHSPEGSPS
jgi:hypothetical protein